ncbi:hypothetical protein GCM10027090_06430 [Sinomonas soli]
MEQVRISVFGTRCHLAKSRCTCLPLAETKDSWAQLLGPDRPGVTVGAESGQSDGVAEGDPRAGRTHRDFHDDGLDESRPDRPRVPSEAVEGRCRHFLEPRVSHLRG